jgi:hypothetical protein
MMSALGVFPDTMGIPDKNLAGASDYAKVNDSSNAFVPKIPNASLEL